MRFRAVPVTSLEDATLNFEQLQTIGPLQLPVVTMPTRVIGTTYRPSLNRPVLVTASINVTLAAGQANGVQLFSDANTTPTTERSRFYANSSAGGQFQGTIVTLVQAGQFYLISAIGGAGSVSILTLTENAL